MSVEAYARWIASLRPTGIEVIDGLHRALPGKIDGADVKPGEPIRAGGYGENFATARIQDNPKDLDFRAYLGEFEMLKGNMAAAAGHFRAALALYPNNAAILNNLALVTASLKQPGALEFAENKRVPTLFADLGDDREAADESGAEVGGVVGAPDGGAQGDDAH